MSSTGIWDCEIFYGYDEKGNEFLFFFFFVLFTFFSIFHSENWLELNVYFQQMSYELIEQQPAYDKESLIGKC